MNTEAPVKVGSVRTMLESCPNEEGETRSAERATDRPEHIPKRFSQHIVVPVWPAELRLVTGRQDSGLVRRNQRLDLLDRHLCDGLVVPRRRDDDFLLSLAACPVERDARCRSRFDVV